MFTKYMESIENLQCESPLGKSDHVLINFEERNENEIINEKYKVKRFKYGRADFKKLKDFFVEVDWKDFEQATDVQEKWNEFLKIYNIAVEKFVPREGPGGRKGKKWFSAKCRSARSDKINAWNRWSKQKTENRLDDYIKARNKYVEIIRMERRKYERDIICKCIDEPKQFYKHKWEDLT